MKALGYSILPLLFILILFISSCSKKGKYNQEDDQGRKQGVWRYYYETGELEKEIHYKDDMKYGKEIRYFPSGAVNLEMEYTGDTLGTYLTGSYKHYYENGQLVEEWNYKDGVPDGKFSLYYQNGQKQQEGQIYNGLKSGIWRYYDEQGNLVKEVDFKDFEQDWTEDYLAGTIKYYSPDGKAYYQETYASGIKMDSIILDQALYDSLR